MLKCLLISNVHVCNCKLVSSILSTLSLPRISILAPDPSLSPSSPSPPPSQHSDALCGSCPSSGSAPQANSLWPSLQPSGAGFPAWPGQPTQPAPCWTGQPNTPCWPGTQPAQVSVPAPIAIPAPAQAITPAPAPTTTIVPAPAPGQPCQPCWPGTQYQLPQPPAPIQVQVPAQVPALTPVPVAAPAPSPATTIRPNVPGWPAHPGWPYNPGQSGWPGQNPSIMPPHWLPPTSGPLVSHMQRISLACILQCWAVVRLF